MESVGRYRLRRVLGEGALGLVYEAVGEDGATVAVKVLRPEWAGDAAARTRFRREARLAGRIESRHVVPVLEVGESYLVLPFYPRGSLALVLREERTLSLDRTVRLAAELGRGLDALHEHGILHRDVKPSNVLVAEDGAAALSDFGLARARDSTRITHDGQLVGTPHYLAPELIEGAEATRASDLYALGCLLYECVAGKPPFTGRRPAEIGFAHLTEAPPDPRERQPGLTEEVALALLAALEKDPQARPTSGTALARMLHVARSASPA
jgi:eukaryotic-like serine/threonine-protein kinase